MFPNFKLSFFDSKHVSNRLKKKKRVIRDQNLIHTDDIGMLDEFHCRNLTLDLNRNRQNPPQVKTCWVKSQKGREERDWSKT